MTQQSTAAARAARPLLTKATGSVLVLLIVTLPGLLAFARIAAMDVSEAEMARVAAAVHQGESSVATALTMFYGAALPSGVDELWAKNPTDVAKAARLAGLLATFAISFLIYLILLLVRGRATAAFGCLGLCLLPPVALEGYVLRPEQCATLFGLMGVVLMIGYPHMLQQRGRSPTRWLPRLWLIASVGACFAIARACLVEAWIYLTIPAGALLLSVLSLALMFPRAVRRIPSWIYWPMRAAARRYVPWMLLVISSFGTTMYALIEPAGAAQSGSHAVHSLLPDSLFTACLVGLLAAVGAIRMSLGVSLRLGRLRRVRPDTVMFLFVAALTMQHFLLPDGIDRLPAAAAVACLLGDGAMTVIVLGLSRLARWRSRGRA